MTNYAQGGIIASAPDDDPELLEKDILDAGCSINCRETVERFSREAPQTVQDFLAKHVGVNFSRNDKGEFDYTEEAAHSRRRILHFEDHTGDAIETNLVYYAQKIGVAIRRAAGVQAVSAGRRPRLARLEPARRPRIAPAAAVIRRELASRQKSGRSSGFPTEPCAATTTTPPGQVRGRCRHR